MERFWVKLIGRWKSWSWKTKGGIISIGVAIVLSPFLSAFLLLPGFVPFFIAAFSVAWGGVPPASAVPFLSVMGILAFALPILFYWFLGRIIGHTWGDRKELSTGKKLWTSVWKIFVLIFIALLANGVIFGIGLLISIAMGWY